MFWKSISKKTLQASFFLSLVICSAHAQNIKGVLSGGFQSESQYYVDDEPTKRYKTPPLVITRSIATRRIHLKLRFLRSSDAPRPAYNYLVQDLNLGKSLQAVVICVLHF